MRRRATVLAAAAGAAVALAAPAPAPARPPTARAAVAYAPRVVVMVAGNSRVLKPPASVIARPATLTAGRRRCAVAGGTPLAALEAARRLGGPSYGLRDFGSCSSSPADAGSLFVNRIGPDLNRGRNGWVYKVGRRAGTTGAADARGPFGTGGRLRPGQRLTWLYCRMGPRGCQPTLELGLAARLSPGGAVTASVRGYDDFGAGRPVAGAVVSLGPVRGLTGPDGRATLTAPSAAGRYRALASAPGAVPSFPVAVTVG